MRRGERQRVLLSCQDNPVHEPPFAVCLLRYAAYPSKHSPDLPLGSSPDQAQVTDQPLIASIPDRSFGNQG